MKKIKNSRYIYILLLVFAGFAACEKEYEQPNKPIDVTWYTSQMDGGSAETAYVVSQGDYIVFSDLSQGATSHTWTISEGNHFLINKFDITSNDLGQFVDKTKALSSDAALVNVLFMEPGLNEVKLHNVFPQEVVYRGSVERSAVQAGNEWVFDTTLVVDVFAPVKPAFKVLQIVEDNDGNVVEEKLLVELGEEDMPTADESDSWPTVNVEAGSKIKFVDMTTTGRPNGREWTINNASEPTVSTEAEVVITFGELGHTAKMGSLKATRTASDSEIVPPGSALKLIPYKFVVVPSTRPFKVVSANELPNETIQLSVGGSLESFTGAESAFTVKVSNPNGFNQQIAVTHATRDPANPTIIQLDLAAPIYANDELAISYDNATVAIRSTDGRTLESFAGQTVSMYGASGENMLDNPDFDGFEAASSLLTEAFCVRYWIGNENADERWKRTEEKAYSGAASMKYSGVVENRKIFGMGITDTQEIPAGTYLVRHKIFIVDDPAVDTDGQLKAIRTEFANKADGWSNPIWTDSWNLSAVPRNSWQTIEKTITLSKTIESRIPATAGSTSRYSYYVNTDDNPGVTGAETFYLDDMELIPKEVRP